MVVVVGGSGDFGWRRDDDRLSSAPHKRRRHPFSPPFVLGKIGMVFVGRSRYHHPHRIIEMFWTAAPSLHATGRRSMILPGNPVRRGHIKKSRKDVSRVVTLI